MKIDPFIKKKLGDSGGVSFEYILDGALRTGENNAKRGAHASISNGLEYADDLVVFETDPARFAEVTKILDETCKDWGSEMIHHKNKMDVCISDS